VNGLPYGYTRKRVYHMAQHFWEGGKVSALCFRRHRAINLKVAYWTVRPAAVTCPRCIKLFPHRILVLQNGWRGPQ
jgi:hypothetical protein